MYYPLTLSNTNQNIEIMSTNSEKPIYSNRQLTEGECQALHHVKIDIQLSSIDLVRVQLFQKRMITKKATLQKALNKVFKRRISDRDLTKNMRSLQQEFLQNGYPPTTQEIEVIVKRGMFEDNSDVG